MNRLVVLIKFNKTDRDNPMYNGMRFKKTLARPEWWENRLRILKDIVWPSLERQLFVDFDVVAPFSTDIDPALCKPTIDFLVEKGAFVCWDDRKLKDFVEPVSFLRELYYPGAEFAKKDIDNIILVNQDSDDLYHPTAFAEIMARPAGDGMTYIFRDGYVYDAQTKRLALYQGGGSPPPFYAMTFSTACLENQYTWDTYCKEYNLKVEHPHLDKTKNHMDMTAGQFVYYFHDFNVTSSWQNPHHANKIKQLVTGEHKQEVILEFGIAG